MHLANIPLVDLPECKFSHRTTGNTPREVTQSENEGYPSSHSLVSSYLLVLFLLESLEPLMSLSTFFSISRTRLS